MDKYRFVIKETAVAVTPDKHYTMLLQVHDTQSGNTVWAAGDDMGGVVASADFIRNNSLNYEDVRIMEFLYKENTPDSVGEWYPLVQELVRYTLKLYLERTGTARICAQWLPEDVIPTMGEEYFRHFRNDRFQVVLHEPYMLEIIPDSTADKPDMPE